MEETTMTSKGQVVIPAALRRAMGLGRGTRFSVERRGDTVVLTPAQRDAWTALDGMFANGPSLTEALEASRRSEVQRDTERSSR